MVCVRVDIFIRVRVRVRVMYCLCAGGYIYFHKISYIIIYWSVSILLCALSGDVVMGRWGDGGRRVAGTI
jgi:hypothetical protein